MSQNDYGTQSQMVVRDRCTYDDRDDVEKYARRSVD
jgi:hypothetical protein